MQERTNFKLEWRKNFMSVKWLGKWMSRASEEFKPRDHKSHIEKESKLYNRRIKDYYPSFFIDGSCEV